MSEFSYDTPLREDRLPTWILLFMAGVIFHIKNFLHCTRIGLHAHKHRILF